MFRIVTNKLSIRLFLLVAIIGLIVSPTAHAQNYLWQSNGNTNWTRGANWGGDGQPGGSFGYGGTTGRLDFRSNAVANYDPVGNGFGAVTSTFNTGRGLVIANTLNGSLAIASGEIRLVNPVLNTNNSPVMANFGNATLSINGTGRLDASGNVNDFIFYYGGTNQTSTLSVTGTNAQFIGNGFDLRRSNGGTGTVNISNGGTFSVSRITLSGGTGANVLNFNGGVLRARTSNAAFFGATGSNLANTTVNIQTGGITVDTNGFNIGIGQSLGVGGGGLTKSGSGQLTLSGNNTYVGTTNIQNGVLILNGNHSGGGTYTVANTAALGGNGTTTSTVTSNGQVSPGDAGNNVGSLTIARLQLNSSSTTQFQLNSNTLTSDKINISGTGLAIGTGAALELNDIGATTISQGTKLSIVKYNGLWNGGLWTFQGNLLANNSEIVVGLNRWLFRYNDTTAGVNPGSGSYSGFVTLQAIPEPHALVLIGFCFVSGLGLSARRRKR